MEFFAKDIRAPWFPELQKLGLTHHLDFAEETLYEKLLHAKEEWPDYTAIDFMGRKISFAELLTNIDLFAGSLAKMGIKAGDRVAICLPNIPQTVIAFYAVNRLAAEASMIHPLSSSLEVEQVLQETKAVALVTLDLVMPHLTEVTEKSEVKHVILTRIQDFLPFPKKEGLSVQHRKKKQIKPGSVGTLDFGALLKEKNPLPPVRRSPRECAVILYSGGTSSGSPKGIMLSSNNFNALAKNIATFVEGVKAGQSMLTILPLFHGFGLGICVHAILCAGITCILVPQFSGKVFVQTIAKKKPSYIAGVPSMYENLIRYAEKKKIPYQKFLLQAFCGGDCVPIDLKNRFDALMKQNGCAVRLREGYGLTETVTACTIAPAEEKARDTVGYPFPGMMAKIVDPESGEELPFGKDGEICLSGAQVMLGYLDAPEETEKSLRTHQDGLIWLHTGDIGYMDEKGFVFFRQRLKRIIKCKAFPVYPSVVEETLLSAKEVVNAAVLGLPDPYMGQRVKAYIILKAEVSADEQTAEMLLDLCRKKLNKWSVPSEIEFRESLPLTKVGKISIPDLLKEEDAKANS